MPAKLLVADTGNQTGALHLAALCLYLEISGVYQHRAIARAIVFAGFRRCQNGEGIMLVAAGAPTGGNVHSGMGNRHPLRRPFHTVAALEMNQIPGPEGQIQTGGSRLIQLDGLLATVFHHRAAGNHVLLRENAVI